jgi:hypothetical protein
MIVKNRWYKTAEGALVRESDPTAAFLAYVPGDEVADPEARQSGLADLEREAANPDPAPAAPAKPEDKATPEPPNKARAKPADK